MAGSGPFDLGWFKLTTPKLESGQFAVLALLLVSGLGFVVWGFLTPNIAPYDELPTLDDFENSEEGTVYALTATFAAEGDNWIECPNGGARTLHLGNWDGGILTTHAGEELRWEPANRKTFGWDFNIECYGIEYLEELGELKLIAIHEGDYLEIVALSDINTTPVPDRANIGSGIIIAGLLFLQMGLMISPLHVLRTSLSEHVRNSEDDQEAPFFTAEDGMHDYREHDGKHAEEMDKRIFYPTNTDESSLSGLKFEGLMTVKHDEERSWCLPGPSHETWNLDDLLCSTGELIDEHPNKIGTPTPAIFTTISIIGIINVGLVLLSAYCTAILLKSPGEDSAFAMFGLFSLVIPMVVISKSTKNHFTIRSIKKTPTTQVQHIRYDDVELVGQVRPSRHGSLSINWGSGESQSLNAIVACYVKKERRVSTGKSAHWVTSWEFEQSVPFVLHDGTGGVLVDPQLFYDVDWGKVESQRVGSRRWTLKALRLGDPVMLHGGVVSDPKWEHNTGESVANTKGRMMSGKAPNSCLERGTEMGVMRTVNSLWEDVGIHLLSIAVFAASFYYFYMF